MRIVEMTGVSKHFGGIRALEAVDFYLDEGEVVGLMGENGAGKSTLMRILSGAETPDTGVIRVAGEPVALDTPNAALDLGIGMIPQELILVDRMTVLENLFLGREIRGRLGLLDQSAMRRRAMDALESLGIGEVDVDRDVGTLSKADQQMIAIARRMLQGGRVFVMDEPTSALTQREIERLFAVIRGICGEGKSVIFISHRLEELLEICDRFSILRDGAMVASFPNGREVSKGDLVRHMIGSEVGEEFPHEEGTAGETLLTVEGVAFRNNQGRIVDGISFELYAGEILGITGLVGVGKTELAQSLVVLRARIAGTVRIANQRRDVVSPVDANRMGVGYVTEDRRGEGLVLSLESIKNMTITILDSISRFFSILFGTERRLAAEYAGLLNMKREYLDLPVGNLSGGNQQKVVLIRRLMGDSSVLMLDEPTKGIDVGAKAEIARLLNNLASEGKGILIFSSEPREILGMSDRILVLTDDGLQGPYERGELDYPRLMAIEFQAYEE